MKVMQSDHWCFEGKEGDGLSHMEGSLGGRDRWLWSYKRWWEMGPGLTQELPKSLEVVGWGGK